ncbi:MAG TPA: aspartate--tRNA ligase [Candidatus Aphodocola excrementigallinarum]|uniref:Aspartate--tRNA(Asp/Asn) ligase n=1 Tax=Candidatus Aphodocola excrementigallinarum TaxID=2840670 RepID=A0A9D1LHS9_9FIRM|nr:aspartate--tRNA ligase [Candidatus Aphodocola excrementigallinarum]
MSTYRTNTCGELTLKDLDKKVTLAGFVSTIRDHGGVMFVDLRDHYGTTQIVVHDDAMLKGVSKETVIKVTGTVVKRDEETINKKIATGEIEVVIDSLELLSDTAKVLPFEVDESKKVSEDVRLKYRFLDLRNPKVHENIITRSKAFNFLRNKMQELGFLEIQTPILTSSSPEGARDFIIPSRKHKGKFYALPQAPQQFKQLLMASGFDKYFQLAPCFRDEDGRADRLVGEFYQLDMEMAFADQEDIMKVAEDVFPAFFKEFGKRRVTQGHFKRIPYNEAMLKYGTDKPDLRNPLEIIDVSEVFTNTEFKPFRGAIVRAIKVDDIATKPNSWFNEVVDYAKSIDMPGIGYISVMEDKSLKGPIDKFLTDEDRNALFEKADLKVGSVLFFIADKRKDVVTRNAGLIRTELGRKLDLMDHDLFEFCFVTDMPMYEISEVTGKLDFMHNPFSMPRGGEKALDEKDPLEIYADQFDVVCNGVELVSGAVRNNRPEVLVKAFEKAGYTEEDIKSKFNALYTAFGYGCPPHVGMALGIDRALMMLLEEDNVRETVAFPLNQNGEDVLTGTPNEVTELQLRETHIKLR